MHVRWSARLNRLTSQMIALTHMGSPVCDIIGHEADSKLIAHAWEQCVCVCYDACDCRYGSVPHLWKQAQSS